jgi:hypothetical protein
MDCHLPSVTRSSMMTQILWKKLQGEKNAYMINKKKILLSKTIGKEIRILRGSRGERESNHHFSGITLKDSRVLEGPGRLKWVGKCQDNHLWNVGAVKEIIGTDIVPIEMKK